MTVLNHHGVFCPYWASASQECRMAKGGVFLPMPEHVSLFCQTKSFTQCNQYAIGCEAMREAIALCEHAKADSRRRFQRIKEEIPVDVAVIDAASNEEQTVIGATTMDMSLDGIRILSQAELHPDLKVFISFSDEFFVPNWKSLGQVRWTKKAAGNDMFESGVVFTDSESCHAVGQHIGVPGLSLSRCPA